MDFLEKRLLPKPSYIPKFSDPDVLRTVIRTSLWKQLFLKERGASWTLLKGLFILKIEMFVSPVRAVLRFNFGRRVTGVIITVMSSLMIIAFNTTSWIGYLATFFPFAAPFLPLVMSPEQIWKTLFIEIHSPNLLIFLGVYVCLSIIHLAVIYTRRDMKNSASFRGQSWLSLLVFRHFRLREYWIHRLLEPSVIALVGYSFLGTDFTFGLFLIIGAVCLFLQENYDALTHYILNP